jgi:hypothetical protein
MIKKNIKLNNKKKKKKTHSSRKLKKKDNIVKLRGKGVPDDGLILISLLYLWLNSMLSFLFTENKKDLLGKVKPIFVFLLLWW